MAKEKEPTHSDLMKEISDLKKKLDELVPKKEYVPYPVYPTYPGPWYTRPYNPWPIYWCSSGSDGDKITYSTTSLY